VFEEIRMAKAKTPSGRRPQTAQPAIAGSAVAADAQPPKKRTSIPQFASQVRAEGRKIVWPSRKETWITSVMVFIMVAVASVFFFVVDAALTYISQFILSIGQ
jgi:preprotein translocase subunit SecE